MKDLSDEELMVHYQNGDKSAFTTLYSRHSAKIYAYLNKRLRNKEFANDIYQEVFIKIHKSKHLYNRSLPVLPWFFSIMHSTMIDGLRKLKSSQTVTDFNFDQLPAPSATTLVGEVQLLTEQLSDVQKTAVQMRFIDDSTFKEIAERLKTTPTNARQLISRGIKRLKQLIEDKGPS